MRPRHTFASGVDTGEKEQLSDAGEKEQLSANDLLTAEDLLVSAGEAQEDSNQEEEDGDSNRDEVRYEIGDKVRTVSGYVAIIESKSSTGLYHLRYMKGDTDINVHPTQFKKVKPPRRRAKQQRWYFAAADEPSS